MTNHEFSAPDIMYSSDYERERKSEPESEAI